MGGRCRCGPESHEIIFPEGAGGLPTLKIGVVYKGKLAAAGGGGYSLSYRDGNFPGRAGWKEIIAVAAPGVKLLNSSVPEVDRSARLSDYPTDLLNSPPQQLEARVGFLRDTRRGGRRRFQHSIKAGNSENRNTDPGNQKGRIEAVRTSSFI